MARKAVTLFLTCLLLVSSALAQGKAAAQKPAKKAAAASGVPDKALMQKMAEGWSTKDPDNVAKYYDKAPSNAYYDITPLKYAGWQQYAEGAKKELSGFKSLKFTMNDDAAVHRSGNLAYGTSTVKMSVTDQAGKSSDFDCRWTVVWEKKGANWLVVHEHFSAPQEPAK